MPRIAILDRQLTTVLVPDATPDQVREVYPELTLGTVLRDDSLDGYPRLRLVREAPRPATDFGEEADEGLEVDGGEVRQRWTRRPTLTLAQAKRALEAMALDIYWDRVLGARAGYARQAHRGRRGDRHHRRPGGGGC